MTEIYQLEKVIWTEKDFEVMGWHDNFIYGLATEIDNDEEPWKSRLVFDVDYIFKWVDPQPPNIYYTFWISPCTLIFHEYYDAKFNFEINSSYGQHLEIDGISLLEARENEHNGLLYHTWKIELQNGEIELKSRGFEQIVRRAPVHVGTQLIGVKNRGGISFDKTPCL